MHYAMSVPELAERVVCCFTVLFTSGFWTKFLSVGRDDYKDLEFGD